MLWFLIPVFNEEENIPGLSSSLVSLFLKDSKGEGVHFVFSDDGSTDGTVNRIKELFGDFCTVIGDGKNHGPGKAFNDGFEYILKHGKPGDSIVTLEGDNTSDLSVLPRMLSLSRTHDLVLASVYAEGGGFDKTSRLKKIMSSAANSATRLVFGLKVKTFTSFYRVYSYALLEKIRSRHKNIISEKGFLCMVEILVKAVKLNASVTEAPVILYSTRRKGKSKMKIWKTAWEYVGFLAKWKTY